MLIQNQDFYVRTAQHALALGLLVARASTWAASVTGTWATELPSLVNVFGMQFKAIEQGILA